MLKVQEHVYSLKKLNFKTQGTTNPQALSSILNLLMSHSQDLRVINSVDPCVLKSKYYL